MRWCLALISFCSFAATAYFVVVGYSDLVFPVVVIGLATIVGVVNIRAV